MINIQQKRTICPEKMVELINNCSISSFGYQQQFMAEQQLQELKQKLQQQQAEFQRYKAECKQLESFLESQSTKKQEQIRKLKQQAILKEKSFGPLKAQVSQLQAENAKLKTQITQLKQQQVSSQQATQKNEEYTKQIEEMKSIISNLQSEKEGLSSKVSSLEAKANEPQKGGKGKSDGDSKKLEDALSASKSKISELERQVEKLREELSRKASVKDFKQQDKKIEKVDKQHKDNKQEQRLRDKVEKLQKKLSESHSQTSRAEQKSIKLSKQLKQMKQKLAGLQSEKQSLSRKLKQAMISNSQRRQQVHMRQEHEQNEQQVEQVKDLSSNQLFFSALMLTKKHYVSPFLQFKSDNSVKIFKSTKNGCFQKSLGSIRCKLNQVTYNPEELIQGCANRIKDNLARGVKCSVVLFGSKKTTKKYLLANLVAKIKDFIVQKISDSQQKPEAIFIKASPDPQKRLQLVGNHPDQVEQILDKIIEMAQKSPKKGEPKKKSQPKPKARYLKISHGSLYLQIITTSFTNIQLRQSQTIAQALNNIAYSRLPNALQPTDCFRQIVLTLNPIVSLYDDCKNSLSIANCKKSNGSEAGNDFELKNSPIKQELNDAARKKLQSIQRQIEQNNLKIRRQEEQITFYKSRFDQLELRLKNLLNTHREQNTYLKKSPVTLSYEKMLKFVHSVQSKNPSFTGSVSKVQQHYGNHTIQENEDYDGLAEEREHDQVDGEAEDIL